MRTLVRYNPGLTMFDRMMTRPMAHLSRTYGNVPAVNVRENEEAFRVEMAVPGLKKENFAISLLNNRLTISARQEQNSGETTEKYTRQEFARHAFERSFVLPKNVDTEQIGAAYVDGILTIDLPKVAVKQPEPKQIAVA